MKYSLIAIGAIILQTALDFVTSALLALILVLCLSQPGWLDFTGSTWIAVTAILFVIQYLIPSDPTVSMEMKK